MASLQENSEILETKKLLDIVEHPNLKSLLQKHLKSLEDQQKKLEAEKLKNESTPNPSFVSENASTIDSTTGPTTIPTVPSSSVATKRPLPTTGKFIPIEDYAWDQGGYNSPIVSIFIDLPDVGKVKSNCNVQFTKMGFDFSVTDLNGKNYRVIKDNLEKDIIPDQSSMVVKANRVILKLQKVKGDYGSYETWNQLTAKKKRDHTTEDAKKKDPMGGIMDMMKDMYEEGDENMKKIIGEAMLKSKQGQGMDPSKPPSKLGESDDNMM